MPTATKRVTKKKETKTEVVKPSEKVFFTAGNLLEKDEFGISSDVMCDAVLKAYETSKRPYDAVSQIFNDDSMPLKARVACVFALGRFVESKENPAGPLMKLLRRA